MSRSRFSRGMFACIAMVILCAGIGSAVPAWVDVFDLVPADSFFCARINNFTHSMSQIDGFTAELSPIPVTATGMTQMQLAGALGLTDPTLGNVEMSGDFAVFGMTLDDGKPFIAGFIPVTDCDKFVQDNANCSEPDERGISKITRGQGEKAKVKQLIGWIGDYAMLSSTRDYDKFAAVLKKIRASKGLSASLNKADAAQAAEAPLLAYINVQRIAELVRPKVAQGLEFMREQLEKSEQQNKSPFALMKIVEIYARLFETMLDQVDTVSFAAEPAPETLRVKYSISAVDGSRLANMLAGAKRNKRIGLLSYLNDDAMMNFASRIDKKMWKDAYDCMFDLFWVIGSDGMNQEDMDKIRDLTNRSINAMGNSLAFSMTDATGKPPFALTYIINVDNREQFAQVMKEEIELYNSGLINKLYKTMGMDLQVKIELESQDYDGVSIDSAKLMISSQDPKMKDIFEKMYGEGFVYHWAMVRNKAVVTMGGDSDASIRALIDRVRSRQRKRPGAKTIAAMKLLGNMKSRDFVGTMDMLGLFRMQMDMVKEFGGCGEAQLAQLPQVVGQSKSNIVFGGSLGCGSFNAEVVIPKAHLLEIKQAIVMPKPQAAPAPKAKPASKAKPAPKATVAPCDARPRDCRRKPKSAPEAKPDHVQHQHSTRAKPDHVQHQHSTRGTAEPAIKPAKEAGDAAVPESEPREVLCVPEKAAAPKPKACVREKAAAPKPKKAEEN